MEKQYVVVGNFGNSERERRFYDASLNFEEALKTAEENGLNSSERELRLLEISKIKLFHSEIIIR